jgi:hypothetical protein
MVQHQPPEFRLAVLPKLKANVEAGQGAPGTYAMVYDRTQRDQGKNRLYGQQLEVREREPAPAQPADEEEQMDEAMLGKLKALAAR